MRLEHTSDGIIVFDKNDNKQRLFSRPTLFRDPRKVTKTFGFFTTNRTSPPQVGPKKFTEVMGITPH